MQLAPILLLLASSLLTFGQNLYFRIFAPLFPGDLYAFLAGPVPRLIQVFLLISALVVSVNLLVRKEYASKGSAIALTALLAVLSVNALMRLFL